MEPQLLTVVAKETLAKWSSEEWANWQIEPKRDGFRLLIVDGIPQSRSGKPLHNIQHILDELGSNVKGVVFDGELHGASWEETSHVASASKSERETKLTYTIFDALTVHEWNNKYTTRTLVERQRWMQKYTPETEHVKFVKPWHVGLTGYAEFEKIHKINLAEGCDGTVLKRCDSLYEFKRSKNWLKVKPVLDCDCLVVGMKEGKGKYKGTLGALEVLPEEQIQNDNHNQRITTFVSGMDDEQRRLWWRGKDAWEPIIGKWIEVSYRKMNPSGKLVEPRFVRIRTDK